MGERNVDARADIYALGAVTYEMLAGEPPFTGPNGQAIIAKVITEDAPSLRVHRRSVPEHADAAVAHALEKLPADRFAMAREFAEALSGRGDAALRTTRAVRARGRAVPASEQRTRSLLWPALGGLVAPGIGALAGAAWHARRMPTLRPARLAVTIPDEQRLVDIVGPPVVFSPDGQALVYVGATASAHTALFYRPLDRLEATELQGTDDAGLPFFSPDGRNVAFATYHIIKRVSVGGGPATPLLDASAANFTIAGGAWGPGGVIVVGSEQGLWQIPESGGTAKLITHVDARSGELYHAMPRFLDGETVAFDVDYATGDGDSRVGLVSLRSGKVTILDVHARNTVGLVDGSLIVGTRGTGAGRLAALPFDARRWRVTGPAVPVLDEVAFKPNGGAEASLADDGSLVYVAGSAESRLVLLDARGAEVGGPAESRTYSGPQYAPDGRHIALAIYSNASSGASSDIWSYEIASGVLSRLSSRVTALYPAWTPDGRSIVFEGAPGHDFSQLWQVAADGSSPEQLVYTLPDGAGFQWRPTFTPDGATMVEEVRTRQGKRHELWVLQRAPDGRWTGAPWLRQDADVENPRLSPDGHWIAYESNETGRFETYVRPFPGPGGRVQVSTSGGRYPEWSRDGHRLYFLPSEMGGHLMQADLRLDPPAAVLGRSEAFTAGGGGIEIQTGGSYYNGDFDIRPDDKGAVVLRSPRGRQVVVVLNWREELRSKLEGQTAP